MAEKVTEENFNELVNSGKLLIIDFWAEWCGPCKTVSPIFDKVSELYADNDKVIIGKCDVEEYPELTVQYTVRNIPTVLIIRDGEVKGRMVGSFTEISLVELIEQHL